DDHAIGSLPKLVPRGARALDHPLEARGAARLGRPRGGPRRAAPTAARPASRRPARDAGPRLRGAPPHVALHDQGRVRRGDREQDRTRGDSRRPGRRRRGRLPRPDGRPGEAERPARRRLPGGDQTVSLPDRLPGDAARGRARMASPRGRDPARWPQRPDAMRKAMSSALPARPARPIAIPAMASPRPPIVPPEPSIVRSARTPRTMATMDSSPNSQKMPVMTDAIASPLVLASSLEIGPATATKSSSVLLKVG